MTPENWKRIKALDVTPDKMFHVSDGRWNEVTGRFIKGTGRTYAAGKNAAKRAAKES